MHKIKVLQLAHNYKPPFVQICHNYSSLFDPNQYLVTTAYLKGEPSEIIRENTGSEKVLFFNHKGRQLRGLKLKAIWQLAKLCKKEKFDIVICHRYKSIYVYAIASLFQKYKLNIAVLHGLDQFLHILRRFFANVFLTKRFYFLGVSNAVKYDILNSGVMVNKSQVFTLSNVIDIEQTTITSLSNCDARAQFHCNANDFIIGNIGRLSPSKDQKTLIKAFAIVKDKIPNAKLIIVGGGRLEQNLKRLVSELKLEYCVKITGEINNAYRLLPAFDLFVLTSASEGFGLVLIEAMANKIPIIATRSGGISDVMGEITQLQKCGDYQGIATAIEKFYKLSEIEKNKIKEQFYQHVKNKYSYGLFKARFQSLFPQYIQTEKNDCTFSIIIPTYNYAYTLKRCLESVLQQMKSDTEIIVIDDGSTDNTKTIITQLNHRYSNKINYHYQENKGQATARNTGISMAKGQYVILLDADDELINTALDDVRSFINKYPRVDMIIGGHVAIQEDGKAKVLYNKELSRSQTKNFKRYLFRKIVIASGATVIKKQVFKKIKYPENLRNREDIPVFAQIFALFNCATLNKPLAKIYKHHDSVRHNTTHVAKTASLIVKELFNENILPQPIFRFQKKFSAKHKLSAFRTLFNAKDFKLAKQYYIDALKIYPLYIFKASYLRKFIRMTLYKRFSTKHQSRSAITKK